MQFFQPWFLIALGSLAIPIIIHLFYFRRYKKVYFSSVRFLKEVKDESSARSRLKNLLVLLARLLALALLVFAFAQPFIRSGVKEKYSRNHVGVFIDNSYSMNALSQDIPLISKAKQKARNVVEAYSTEDRFMILSHDFEGKHLRLIHQDEALAMIDEIKATPVVKNLLDAKNRIKNVLASSEGNEHIYLISDFQRSITNLDSLKDSVTTVHLLPLQSVEERNVAIDTAWFDSPVQLLGQSNLLKFKLHNYGNQKIQNARVSIKQNNQSKPVSTINLEPGQSLIDTAQIIIQQTGWQELELEITDYPVQFDDKLFISFNVESEIKVTIIESNTAYTNLETALKSLPSVKTNKQIATNINYSKLDQNHLIILHGLMDISSGLANELTNAIASGSNVLIFPAEAINLASYNLFMQSIGAATIQNFEKKTISVSELNTQEFTFKDVYAKITANMRLPMVQGRYLWTKGGNLGEESLMTFTDGKPYLSKYRSGAGSLFLCASPLDEKWNDLSRNPEIFIPLLFRTAISKGKSSLIMRFIGNDEIIELDRIQRSSEQILHLKNISQTQDLIPFERNTNAKTILDVKGAIKESGFYDISVGDTLLGKLAFNFNRKESDLSTMHLDEIKNRFGGTYDILDNADSQEFGAWLKEKKAGKSFWKWCIIGTLLFLLIESLLLRFWKT